MGELIYMKNWNGKRRGGIDGLRIDPDDEVAREIRRYQALRQIGWTDDLCESCRRKIWLRAGEDAPQLSAVGDHGPI